MSKREPKPKLTKEEAAGRVEHYAWCRGVGHWWRKAGIEKDGFTYYVRLQCQHCGCWRTTGIKHDGVWASKSHNRYKYPDDYQTPGFKADRADARAAAFFGSGKAKAHRKAG